VSPIAPILEPVADIFAAVTAVFQPIPYVFPAIADVFQPVPKSAVMLRIAPIFEPIAPVFTTIDHVLPAIPAILPAVANVFHPVADHGAPWAGACARSGAAPTMEKTAATANAFRAARGARITIILQIAVSWFQVWPGCRGDASRSPALTGASRRSASCTRRRCYHTLRCEVVRRPVTWLGLNVLPE
jgi:hypothetical protein